MTGEVAAHLDRLLTGEARWWRDSRWCEHVADHPYDSETVAMAGLGARLRRGDDPEFVIGETSADAALTTAREWLACCVPAMDVALWLALGCNRPEAARMLIHRGVYAQWLLDENGEPARRAFVEIGGKRITAARAVADGRLSASEAARIIRGR